MSDTPKKKPVRRLARKAPKPAPPSNDTVVLEWLIERLEALGGRYGALAGEARKRR